MTAPRRRLRPSRPLRKRPRLDDLADEEPESSSYATSSESSEGSPPPDFAADADDEDGYVSAVEETPSPKPQPKRPSRLAKPRSFLDAVRPYVEPMSKDAMKLSQLTMAEITAGEAYRGPLVVTDADRAEAEAARATADRLARYDSDAFVDDRDEVLPQIQTRPFSLKRRTRSHSSEVSSSDSELLSGESGSDCESEPNTDDSPHRSVPTKGAPASHSDDDERQGIWQESSDYESEHNRSPPRKMLHLIRNDKITQRKHTNGRDSASRDSHPEHKSDNAIEESISIVDLTPTRNCHKPETRGLSGLESRVRSIQLPSGMIESPTPTRVIDVIDLSQDPSSELSIQLSRTEAVKVRSEMRRSTNTTEGGPSNPPHVAPSRLLDIIDLCDDS